MQILSCFVDESGQQDMSARYYILTLVLHNQINSLAPFIYNYEKRLLVEGLPDISFHAVDLIHGHKDYQNLSPETRKRLLVAFSMFTRTLPVSFKCFSYDTLDANKNDDLQTRMRQDIVNFLFKHLEKFQEFNQICIYYDGGHAAVTNALRQAFDYALARNVAIYKELSHANKRLAQVADYLTTIELGAKRYESGNASASYVRFLG